MEEANAYENREKKYIIQTEIIELIFEIAFTILKVNERKLLPYALDILIDHSHLVNLEIVLDLIQCLSENLESYDFGPFLQACTCTFRMLQGRGRAIEFDLQYYRQVYARLHECCLPKHHEVLPNVIQTLKLMLIERKSISKNRILAFIKKMLGVSIQTDPKFSEEILDIVSILFARNFNHII
eukprot:UN27442